MTRDEAAAVFHRAAQLEKVVPTFPDRIDLGSLEDIGEQAGLSREAVRRATLEMRAGLLDTRPPPGSRAVRVHRHLAGDPEAIGARLEATLKRQTFLVVRRQPDFLVAVRSKSLVATVNRHVDPLGRQVLSPTALHVIEARLASGAGRTVVHLEGDMRRSRRNWAAMPGVGLLASLFIAFGTLVDGLSAIDMLAVPVVAVVMAASVAGAISGFRSSHRHAARALEGLLDRVESG